MLLIYTQILTSLFSWIFWKLLLSVDMSLLLDIFTAFGTIGSAVSAVAIYLHSTKPKKVELRIGDLIVYNQTTQETGGPPYDWRVGRLPIENISNKYSAGNVEVVLESVEEQVIGDDKWVTRNWVPSPLNWMHGQIWGVQGRVKRMIYPRQTAWLDIFTYHGSYNDFHLNIVVGDNILVTDVAQNGGGPKKMNYLSEDRITRIKIRVTQDSGRSDLYVFTITPGASSSVPVFKLLK